MTSKVESSTYTLQPTDRYVELETSNGNITVYVGPGTETVKLTKSIANYNKIILIADGCKINGKDIIIFGRKAEVTSVTLKPKGNGWIIEDA